MKKRLYVDCSERFVCAKAVVLCLKWRDRCRTSDLKMINVSFPNEKTTFDNNLG